MDGKIMKKSGMILSFLNWTKNKKKEAKIYIQAILNFIKYL